MRASPRLQINYRHHFHAGNFADVVKHALLVQLVLGMQRKPKGCLVLDTHAGRGAYDLDEAGFARASGPDRRPEHPEGIGRLRDRSDLPGPVGEYVDLVRRFGGSSLYPGSPWILRTLAREQDRLVLCERQPDECEALRRSMAGQAGVSVREIDGYGALAANLPPLERRALVLIDPPFEDADEGLKIAGALREGLRRLPAGLYAIWHPLTERGGADTLAESLMGLNLPPTLAIEVDVDPPASKMRGCGVIVVNPPWQFEATAREISEFLGIVLAQGPRSGAALRWLVPE